MEYVFQITKETQQNINLDFQLKATYGIDFEKTDLLMFYFLLMLSYYISNFPNPS